MNAATHSDPKPFGLLAAKLTGYAMDRKTRALLSRGDSPRSGEPVWRNSYTVGQIENRIWKPINGGDVRNGKRWAGAMLKAAKAFEVRTKAERQEVEPGARNGALGAVGLAVLEFLYATVDYKTGRLEPAIRTIADEIGYAYSAVHLALVRLRQHGFLQWMRRSKPIDDPRPNGPRIEQASNAYALLIPEKMKGWIARLIGKGPTPACEEDRAKCRKAAFEDMISGLTASEYQLQPFNDKALFGSTLRRIAAAVDAREAKERESCASDETGGLY